MHRRALESITSFSPSNRRQRRLAVATASNVAFARYPGFEPETDPEPPTTPAARRGETYPGLTPTPRPEITADDGPPLGDAGGVGASEDIEEVGLANQDDVNGDEVSVQVRPGGDGNEEGGSNDDDDDSSPIAACGCIVFAVVVIAFILWVVFG